MLLWNQFKFKVNQEDIYFYPHVTYIVRTAQSDWPKLIQSKSTDGDDDDPFIKPLATAGANCQSQARLFTAATNRPVT